MVNEQVWKELKRELDGKGVTLVAVSKTKPVEDIQALYNLGQLDFGENYVQELSEKQLVLPSGIRWHYIGHLQTNKVKYIAPFVHLIHAVDSFKLITEINKQALKNDRIIDVLLQLHIADEDTKYGLDENKVLELLEYYEAQQHALQNVRICGLMGMSTFTDDDAKVRAEFARLHNVFRNLQRSNFLGKPWFSICSMGMSGDYAMAIEEGSNLVRIGSLLFGQRK